MERPICLCVHMYVRVYGQIRPESRRFSPTHKRQEFSEPQQPRFPGSPPCMERPLMSMKVPDKEDLQATGESTVKILEQETESFPCWNSACLGLLMGRTFVTFFVRHFCLGAELEKWSGYSPCVWICPCAHVWVDYSKKKMLPAAFKYCFSSEKEKY